MKLALLLLLQQVPTWQSREVMIPMRDGVKLFAVVVSPANQTEPLPIIMTRTPYGAGGLMRDGSIPPWKRELAADGYIFVEQDIRGKNHSEGQFEMNRPNRPDGDTTGTDESTDTWDTIEWLIHNVPNNNGNVGIMGVSYPGWLAEEPLIGAHPALKAVSPQAPMTDTWLGDDFFHQGAFRQTYGFEYGWDMEREYVHLGPLPVQTDAYDWYLRYPSLKALADSNDAMRLPTWRRFVEHPAYDSVWQSKAFERRIHRLTVPTLVVGGFWDQEDLFGPQETYRTLERLDHGNLNYLVIGPWSHGQWSRVHGGDSLGNIGFGSFTSDSFRLNIQAPWFAYWLKGRGDGRFPEARLFDAGTNQWHAVDSWPPLGAHGRSLYFHANGVLSFDPPVEQSGADQWVSDPANPVPYRPRPVEATYSRGSRWARWMTEDQRFVAGRPDVKSWQTAPLDSDVTIAGDVVAHLFASTTGSDADWVVKLIDVRPEMGGYQLMVAGDIMRGRYRRSWERPEAIRPGDVDSFAVDLHDQLYTFRRGHRIMVQVQSTWFPLYDRNPQTFVPNIFLAPASAYRSQTHRIVRTALQPSRVDVLVVGR